MSNDNDNDNSYQHGEWYIFRTMGAGVIAGKLESRRGMEAVVMAGYYLVWHWESGAKTEPQANTCLSLCDVGPNPALSRVDGPSTAPVILTAVVSIHGPMPDFAVNRLLQCTFNPGENKDGQGPTPVNP